MTRPSLARRWVRFADAHRQVVLIAGGLLALAGLAGTVLLYSDLRPDMSELLPANARSALDLDEVSARVGGWAEESIIITGADRETLKRFADDLHARLLPHVPESIRWVEYRVDHLATFFAARAWLFPRREVLEEVRDRVAARVRWEKQRANPLFVALDEDEKPPSLDDLEEKLGANDQGLLSRFPEGYFIGEIPGARPGEKVLALVMLVRVAGNPNDFKQLHRVDGIVRDAVAALEPARRAPSLKVAYGGYVASNILEHDALAEDLVVASLLVFLAVALSLILYYRTWKSVPLIGLPLTVGALLTFGVAYLKVGHLNSNTAFLGSIILGNGINASIILVARYLEERRKGLPALAAMELAVESTWLATFTASLAAGVSYASLMATDFRGFNQFGFIGGTGMALCWLSTFTLVPPLALAWERRAPVVRSGGRLVRSAVTGVLARLVERAPRLTLVAGLVCSLGAVVHVARLARDPIENDFTRLRDSRAMSPGGPGWWDQRVDRLFGEHLTPNVFLCRNEREARAVARALEAERDGNPHSLLGSVTSVASFVPEDQEAKLPVIAQIRALATPDVLALAGPARRAQLERAIPPAGLEPFGTADLPRSLLQQITEVDGRLGTPVLVYPSAKTNVWDGRDVLRFTDELRGVRLPRTDIPVASPMLVFADALRAIGRDGPLATGLAFLGVLAFVVLAFFFGSRHASSLRDAAWVVASLLLGVLWFGGLAGGLGLRLNMLNFIVLPITFGIGVDYATNLVQRRRLDPTASIADCVRTTGGAVALCSLTTVLGYSSLLVARNQALNSFGLLADLGELACLAAAVVGLPAMLQWRASWRSGSPESTGTATRAQ